MARPVIDVAVFSNWGVISASVETWSANRPLSIDIELGEGVRLAPVDDAVADYVFELCSPHRLREEPTRQFKGLYAFSRRDDADETAWMWDPQQRITTAIALSRLAHPTSVGFEDSARLLVRGQLDQIEEAVPGPIKDFGSLAFCTIEGSEHRNWLTNDDAMLTAKLMAAYYRDEESRPSRLNRALWQHEAASRTHFLELRWVMVVTGLEALINVDEQRTRQQFRTRTVGLAERLGVAWSDTDALDAYRLRSKLTHGQRVDDTGVVEHALYTRMEGLLRSAVKDALLEPKLSAILAEDDAIRQEWPVSRT